MEPSGTRSQKIANADEPPARRENGAVLPKLVNPKGLQRAVAATRCGVPRYTRELIASVRELRNQRGQMETERSDELLAPCSSATRASPALQNGQQSSPLGPTRHPVRCPTGAGVSTDSMPAAERPAARKPRQLRVPESRLGGMANARRARAGQHIRDAGERAVRAPCEAT